MTYDAAVTAITTRLNALSGLPDVSDAPLHPDQMPETALYFYDDAEELDSADIVRSQPSESTARAILLLKLTRTASQSAAKRVRAQIDAIVLDLHEYSGTQPGFTVFVSRVRYAYDLAHAEWATAILTLTIEGYRP